VLDKTFSVRIDPGGHNIRVRADENVLGAALAAGIRLPHSCRAGRCASCKSKLVAGRVEYPLGTPPGITPEEIARGEVLLCQARPCSDLVVAARRIALDAPEIAGAEILAVEPLPLGALRIRLRITGALAARPGQFVNAANIVGDLERLAVIARRPGELDLEAIDDGSALRLWLARDAVPGSTLRLTGPFNSPR
jgi:CDP-4-dehydro-6-deoxyglucose reductase, E3